MSRVFSLLSSKHKWEKNIEVFFLEKIIMKNTFCFGEEIRLSYLSM